MKSLPHALRQRVRRTHSVSRWSPSGLPTVCDRAPALLATVGLACVAPPVASAQDAVIRDSTGIRIVENAPPRDDLPLWYLADAPDLVIESEADDGSFILHRVSEARFLSDGRMVVHNFGFELLWFDSNGNLLARGGGTGEGPNESREVVRLEVLGGDTVLAVSGRPPSRKMFGPDGRFIRSDATPAFAHVVTMGLLGDGAWAGVSFGGEFPREGGMFRELWHVVRYTPDLTSADTLLALDGNTFGVLGGPRGHFTVGGGVVVAGHSDTYELKVFGDGGGLIHVIRNAMPNPGESRLMESARAAPAREADERGARLRRVEAPVMETAPAYDWVFVANNAEIWVRRRAGPDEETVRTNIRYSSSNMSPTSGLPLWVAEELDGQEWHVFDGQGTLRARALLPPRFRPTEITDSRVLGVWKDELGVESIRVFRLMRE